MSTNAQFPVLLNVTIAETDDHCTVKADITGFRAKNVRVTPWDDSLIVEMTCEDRPLQSYYLGEPEPEAFKRVIPLGFKVRTDSVMTHYQSGKLKIGVAKSVRDVNSTQSSTSSYA